LYKCQIGKQLLCFAQFFVASDHCAGGDGVHTRQRCQHKCKKKKGKQKERRGCERWGFFARTWYHPVITLPPDIFLCVHDIWPSDVYPNEKNAVEIL